jgi:hypothetical protein
MTKGIESLRCKSNKKEENKGLRIQKYQTGCYGTKIM